MSNDTNANDEQEAVDITPDSIVDKETPDSLAEATTAPLADDALGGNAIQDDVNK